MKDYYKILGIERSASQDEIKKAYRRLAHQYHPDKAGHGGEAKFKEINEAYQILGNSKKRQEYDRFGESFAGGGAPGFDFSGSDFGDFQRGFDFGDVFEDLFEFGFGFPGRRQGRQKRGRDISIDLEISFEEAVFGTERRVLLRKNNVCEICKGSGGEPGAKTINCPVCAGSGTIRETRRTVFGTLTQAAECAKCNGKGSIPEKSCEACAGSGIVKKEKEIRLNIPAGIENNEVIKLSAEGEAIMGGVPGDLYARIHTRPHPVFQREGHNLLMELKVPLSKAIIGEEEKIETLDGFARLKIPAGIDSGEILRIRERGVPFGRGQRGDLIIKIIVKTPKKLTKKIKDLAEELKKEGE